MTLYYHPDYVAAAHVFTTTRKPAWVHEDLVQRPLPGIRWSEPVPLTPAQFTGVHTPSYVEAVRTGQPEKLARSNGFPWDPGIWTSAIRSSGGVVAAALEAYRSRRNTGSLSSGLHHARCAQGAAFCTFNGLVAGAHAALNDGARCVLILDLDAHGGGGTHDIISREPRILHVDIATNGYDRYLPEEPCVYECVVKASEYLDRVEKHLRDILEQGPIDLCLYNAGVDCHEADPGGGLDGLTTEMLRLREETVFKWGRASGIPIAFVLAGGYPGFGHTKETVVSLHRQTVAAALAASIQ